MGAYKKGKNWYIDFYVNGQRKREMVGPSKKEAELVLGKRKAEVRENRYFDVKKEKKITTGKARVVYKSSVGLTRTTWAVPHVIKNW